MEKIDVGQRVRFRPNPDPKRGMISEGVVVRRRQAGWLASSGWLDVACDDGKERSVRPSRCEVIR